MYIPTSQHFRIISDTETGLERIDLKLSRSLHARGIETGTPHVRVEHLCHILLLRGNSKIDGVVLYKRKSLDSSFIKVVSYLEPFHRRQRHARISCVASRAHRRGSERALSAVCAAVARMSTGAPTQAACSREHGMLTLACRTLLCRTTVCRTFACCTFACCTHAGCLHAACASGMALACRMRTMA
eukprot:6187880-Pleurochrysis_carterae.AAC.5